MKSWWVEAPVCRLRFTRSFELACQYTSRIPVFLHTDLSRLALPVSTDTTFVRDQPVYFSISLGAACAVFCCCWCRRGDFLLGCLPWMLVWIGVFAAGLGSKAPALWRLCWSIGQGQAYASCMLGIMISRRPAGQSRPGPVQGPAPGRSCLVRRWVRPRPAAKPAAQRKAAREPAPTARPAPATELRLVLALRPVRAWVLLFIGRVYKHGASIYEMRTGTCMCRSAHKTRTHMIRCIDEPTSTETVARSVNEWQSKSKGSRDEAATIE